VAGTVVFSKWPILYRIVAIPLVLCRNGLLRSKLDGMSAEDASYLYLTLRPASIQFPQRRRDHLRGASQGQVVNVDDDRPSLRFAQSWQVR
jgi:hypothetical protein